LAVGLVEKPSAEAQGSPSSAIRWSAQLLWIAILALLTTTQMLRGWRGLDHGSRFGHRAVHHLVGGHRVADASPDLGPPDLASLMVMDDDPAEELGP
jgi:hypothetical protein